MIVERLGTVICEKKNQAIGLKFQFVKYTTMISQQNIKVCRDITSIKKEIMQQNLYLKINGCLNARHKLKKANFRDSCHVAVNDEC